MPEITPTPQLDYQKTVAFKIWYSDSVVEAQGEDLYQQWIDAPDDDIQVIMIYFERLDGRGQHTRLHASGYDYYALNKNLVFTGHFDDINQVNGVVKYGKFMNLRKLADIEAEAFDDYGDWIKKPQVNQPEPLSPERQAKNG